MESDKLTRTTTSIRAMDILTAAPRNALSGMTSANRAMVTPLISQTASRGP